LLVELRAAFRVLALSRRFNMWLLALALPRVWLGAALRPEGMGAVWGERREGMGSWICVGRVSIEERRSLVAFEEGASARCELVLRLVKELGVD
jgi:hypothetical protein